jgi:hypothetical protein
MVDWAAIGAIVPALAVVVTLIIFIVESHRRGEENRARLKREAISRLLDSMESSIRKNQGLLASLRFWESPDITYARAIPRLIHDLGPENAAVSAWAMSQVQKMIASTSDKQAANIGTQMSMKIVSWGQGTVPGDWFAAELRSHPLEVNFKVRGTQRLKRGSRRFVASGISELALFAMIAASIDIIRHLPKLASMAKELSFRLVHRARA